MPPSTANSPSTTPSPIPLFYRIMFTYIDPMFCCMGAAMHLFDQQKTLIGYSPFATTVSTSMTKTTTAVPLLLENLAGFFLTLGVLEALLLRVKSNDVAVWRCVQASAFILDVAMVWTHSKALSVEGRWDVLQWRGDDWRNIAGNVAAGLPRLCCALGIGMGGLRAVKGKTA